jgi:hypothetical protein
MMTVHVKGAEREEVGGRERRDQGAGGDRGRKRHIARKTMR